MKRKVLKTMNVIMAGVFLIGAGSIDTPETILPVVMCSVSLAWFALFMYANRDLVGAR